VKIAGAIMLETRERKQGSDEKKMTIGKITKGQVGDTVHK